MALAVETVRGNSALGSGSCATASFALATSNIALALVTFGDSTPVIPSGAITSIVWNTSETFTAVPSSEATDGNFCSCRLYYLLNPTATTSVVTATSSTGVEQFGLHVIALSGADVAGTPLGTANAVGNDVGADPTLVVSSAAGDIVVSVLCTDAESSTTNGGTNIFVATLNSDTDHYSQYQTASGASTNCTWTSGASAKAMAGVAVKASGGGNATASPTTATATAAVGTATPDPRPAPPYTLTRITGFVSENGLWLPERLRTGRVISIPQRGRQRRVLRRAA